MAKIAVVGAGYVGLTTGACLASLGHDVVVADIDTDKVDLLKQGQIPFVEEGLEQIVRDGSDAGRLRFVVGAAEACADAEFHYLCVPTPLAADGTADLSFITAAATSIAGVLPTDAVIVNKSTVPVGTTTVVEGIIARPDVAVVSNPEFLREGSAVHDFLHPDRIVIGAADPEAARRVRALYDNVDAPILITDPVSSELVKYASNAFLATKLTFANEIATLCEKVGADADQVLLGMGLDPRVGTSFLKPGPGWGGSCFPKDTATMVQIAASAGLELDFLTQIIEMNDRHIARVGAKVRASLDGELAGKTIAVWGLTFKAGTDDLRASPALAVLEHLQGPQTTIVAYDPTVTTVLAQASYLSISADPVQAAANADVLVVLTEWPEFSTVDATDLAAAMKQRRIVDARNVLDRDTFHAAGFDVVGVGTKESL